MGQNEIWEILKKNPNKFFSIEELAKISGINFQSAFKTMEKLDTNGDIKTEIVIGRTNHPSKMYSFRKKDDYLEDTLHEFKYLKQDPMFSVTSSDHLLLLIIIKELKEIKELMKNGSKE